MKPLAPNTMIQNRYLVVHLIGKGGMGEVYLAVDQRLGSAVALKRTSFAGDQTLAAAFEREARILARLRHPVLPKVSDHFEQDGELYLVMEHISGDDLSNRLEAAGKAFPVSWVVYWADQLLDALSYLHTHEPPIIHRDIKPQNLKLTDENHIILLDFGLSKDTAGQSVVSRPGSSGSVVGYTPHFAPMEQIRGTGTNARSDIYSLSATLYQLLTNTVPIDALSRADAMLNGQPDPIVSLTAQNPEISPAISNTVLKGLEVSQEKRFSTAVEMQKALRAAYAQVQNDMSANTVVFNLSEHTAGDIHGTSPPQADTGKPVNPSEMQTQTTPPAPLVAEPEPIVPAAVVVDAPPNVDATVRMDAPPTPEPTLQANVKTEVFLAADIAAHESPSEPPPVEDPRDSEVQDVPADVPSFGSPNENGDAAPDFGGPMDTVPLISLPDEARPSGDLTPQDEPSTPEFFQTATAAGGGTSEPTTTQPEPQAAEPQVAPPNAVMAAPKKKSRMGLVLGGLFGLLVLVGIAGAGGWFAYNKYVKNGGLKASASPSPSIDLTPSPSPTATPEPTVTPQANVNGNTNSDELIVSPTPVPTSTTPTVSGRPTPEPTPAKVPKTTKTPVTIGTKPTPKPKTKDDRTVILQ